MSETAKVDQPVLDRFDVRGKSIVITGASRGLGLSFARMLASVGASVAGIDVHDTPSKEFADLCNAGQHRYYAASVTDYEGLKTTVDKIYEDFGHIDGLIPAAGIIRDKPLLEYTEKDWRDTIDVDLTGVWFAVQHCAAKMVEQKTGGSIVCISSTAAHVSLAPQTIVGYTAAKFGVRGMVKQVAQELAVHKIRVNCLAPGTMLTDMLQGVMDASPDRRGLFEGACAQRRLATPDELWGIVLYLLSSASSYATGQDFIVDGGLVGHSA